MKDIISPIDKQLLEKELNSDRFTRKTNNGNNEIYTITNQDSPNVMLEIGRLREITFRDAKGGTGNEVDIDKFDISDVPYKQLLVWNPEEKEIIGGYRYIDCKEVTRNHQSGDEIELATAELFNFSEKFIADFLPHTIELGRSFVQPKYQPTRDSRKGLFSLDNLWDGLGAIVIDHPEIKYFFGKVTMYPHFNHSAKDMILYFLFKYFPDKESLVIPKEPLTIKTDLSELDKLFNGGSYEADYKLLIQAVRSINENIPPLVNAYMNLTSTMRTFGTAINKEFGSVEETGILVTIGDIYDIKKERHVATYKKKEN